MKYKDKLPFGKADPNALKPGEEIKAIEAEPGGEDGEKKEGDLDASGADLLDGVKKINS